MSDLAPFGLLAGQVLLVALFSLLSFRKGWLTVRGAAAAFVLGALIVLATNLLWLLVLVSLLAYTALATRFKFAEKQARGVSEGKSGARKVRNVLANGLVPCIVAVLAPFVAVLGGRVDWPAAVAIAFTSAVASAGADTMASELGCLSDKVYMITSFRRVPPGTDGGVSLAGQGAALLGAGLISATGLVLLGVVAPLLGLALRGTPDAFTFLVPVLAGFIGCQVDSLFGATLEIRGLVNKEEVNLLGILAGTVVGLALAVAR
ncbi:MAG: DUF92 domain-containing protein [Halobacteriales archaeon]|nr:DUF92 domain-containing protein [Halobacteriales archaeon]